MKLTQAQMTQLETPCIVIDVDKARENCETMQREANRCKCALRPHVKTHKMPFFAQMQMKLGAGGVTCCKVSEAEIMADGGVLDIFLAYPLVGKARLERAMILHRRVDRLIFGVDSVPTAKLLQEAAQSHHLMAEVRMEVDTGAGRTGVPLERAVELAQQIEQMPNLKLTGIYTFKSLVFEGRPTTNINLASREEGELLQQVVNQLKTAGICIKEVSGGSTPTGVAVARTGVVTEIRPGTYIFNDYMLVREGYCKIKDVAVRMYATVVSTPRPDYAVLDGGTKAFSTDIPLGVPPYYYPGYAVVEGNPDLELRRMNEEHGMLISRRGETGLQVGDVVSLIPVHVCTTINLHNQVYLLEQGCLKKCPVSARGTLH